MSSIEELKKAANPFDKLSEKMDKVIEKSETQIILLSRLCDLKEDNIEKLQDICDYKEDQKIADNDWRVYAKASHKKDWWLGLGVLSIALVALWMDHSRGWPMFNWLKNLIG